MDIEFLRERADIFKRVRRFFDERGYLETVTPVLSPNLIPETCLEVFETAYIPPMGSRIREKQSFYLVPSPEIWMKKLISAHKTDVYQLCPCFRNVESTGRLHSPEFTMLEFYTMGADYEDSIDITEDLFVFLLDGIPRKSIRPPFERISMDDAFSRFAGFSLYAAAEKNMLEAEARGLGLEPPPGTDVAALFDLIFIHTVEPNLPRDRPVVLKDYPSFVPCLAKKRPDGKSVERWELYVRGIELANCYSEETDPLNIRAYFEQEAAAKKKNSLIPHVVDDNYWQIFDGFPPCSGVAMGVDRLIMSLTGRTSIDGVLPFPMGR
ncbi:MAG: LysR family transcriptional regulator [Treponema sp.]|jgi:lysyl-tRNA synthetase class 2|nr:LysR family transcriptional regulator [Treponema sp.]